MGSKASKVLSSFDKDKGGFEVPEPGDSDKVDMKSLEYDIYMEEEGLNTLPKTLYEKASNIASKLIPLEPDKKTRDKMEEAIKFAHLNVTPRGVLSFTILVGFLMAFGTAFLLISGAISLSMSLVFFCLTGGLSYYFYTYPYRLKKIYELRVGSEIVMMILHMVIYMRNYPNLEGAVRFATSNLHGPLALDLKKLTWDVHMGVYSSMEQGLLVLSQSWKGTFRAFSDSINAIIYSLYTSGKRRTELLDESVDIILDSLSERSNTYVTKLKSPISLVNALGILLPIMVLTMMPIVTLFLDDIPPAIIFGGYNIFLPMLLLFVIKNILDQRVVTLPEPDLSLNPRMPPKDKFMAAGIPIYCFIPAALLLLPFLVFAMSNWAFISAASDDDVMKIPANMRQGLDTSQTINKGLYQSYFVVFGLFISLALFFYLSAFQKIKFRKEILEMEDEFREVLFGLGQEVDRGIPIEVGLTKIAPTLRGQYALNLIEKIMDNINYKSMTFESAIFDQKEGAIRYFPSRTIHSVMKAVTDASKKGTKISAEIMISISKYLSNIHRTQEIIMDRFSEILGGMKMQAQILLPLICAVMSVITYMMIQMMNSLSQTMSNLSASGGMGAYQGLLAMFQEVSISPGMFQLAVGIYAIETIIIITWFMNGIVHGVDKVNLHDNAWRNLLVGGILYIVISAIALSIFMPFLSILQFGGMV
jgi:hypothetical protein